MASLRNKDEGNEIKSKPLHACKVMGLNKASLDLSVVTSNLV